jgi:DNA-binding CsgD family transcriptional regulator
MPMRTERETAELIGAIYEATLTPGARTAAFRGLCAHFDASALQLYAIDKTTRRVLYQAGHDIPDAYSREYAAYYSTISDRNELVIRKLNELVLYDDHISGGDAGRRGEIDAWRRSFGFCYFIAGRLFDSEDVAAVVALHRSEGQGHVDREGIARFRALLPHLRRAFLIESRLAGLDLTLASALGSMDMLRFGVVLIGTDSRILWLNREARRIVDEGAGLRAGPAGLEALRPIDRPKLQHLIDGAIGTSVGRRASGGGYQPIAKRGSERPYSVLAAPTPRPPAFPALERPAAILFVTDPDATPETPPDLLRRVYGLTRMEANVAMALVGGATVEAAAERLAIARATARRHLAGIFAKTGTHRQTDLVRLILSAPPPPLH